TIVDDRLAQVAADRDVVVTPHDAAIGILIQLDTAAAAILRSFAGRLGMRERMRQRKLRALHGRDTEARGHADRRAFMIEGEVADRIAETAEERARRVEAFVGEEQRKAIARDARSEDIG